MKIIILYTTVLFLFVNLKSIDLITINKDNQNAINYVGNAHPENGLAQLQLLLNEGLTESNYVLEIGCGALVASIPIISFLDRQHYVGIEPNKWLISDSVKILENYKIVAEKQPIFLNNYQFDATECNIKFDYIISHSVISHASLAQFKLFLENCSKVLRPGGKVIFSLRLTEENEFDGLGEKEESITDEWQYPGNTFFHRSTIVNNALNWFSTIIEKNEYKKIIMESDPTAFHDWFVLIK